MGKSWGDIPYYLTGGFVGRNVKTGRVTMLQCYTYVKKFLRQCVSPAPMVKNAKGFLENALMCWGIGEEGGEERYGR